MVWVMSRPQTLDGEDWKIDTASHYVNEILLTPLETFKKNTGSYPTMKEGLEALLVAPENRKENWKGPYIAEFPTDPWGNRYVYRFPGERSNKEYDLFSLGMDGIVSEDDIGNW